MTANVQGTLGSRGYFFLNNIDGSGWSRVNEVKRRENTPSRNLYQTESTIYFILGILRTDL